MLPPDWVSRWSRLEAKSRIVDYLKTWNDRRLWALCYDLFFGDAIAMNPNFPPRSSSLGYQPGPASGNAERNRVGLGASGTPNSFPRSPNGGVAVSPPTYSNTGNTSHGHGRPSPTAINPRTISHALPSFQQNAPSYSQHTSPTVFQAPISTLPGANNYHYVPKSSQLNASLEHVFPPSRHEQPSVPTINENDRLGMDFQGLTLNGSAPCPPNPSPRRASQQGQRSGEGYLIQGQNDGPEDSLDTRYQVQTQRFFVVGRVFALLWHENAGRNGTQITQASEDFVVGRFGQKIYSSIRRMVVVKQQAGCSWCIPVSTYSGKGVLKRGVDVSKHSVIFMKGSEPITCPGEPSMSKAPIEVQPDRPDRRLDHMSRLNFGKIYTVEHNVRVFPIGQITPRSMPAFNDYVKNELSS